MHHQPTPERLLDSPGPYHQTPEALIRFWIELKISRAQVAKQLLQVVSLQAGDGLSGLSWHHRNSSGSPHLFPLVDSRVALSRFLRNLRSSPCLHSTRASISSITMSIC